MLPGCSLVNIHQWPSINRPYGHGKLTGKFTCMKNTIATEAHVIYHGNIFFIIYSQLFWRYIYIVCSCCLHIIPSILLKDYVTSIRQTQALLYIPWFLLQEGFSLKHGHSQGFPAMNLMHQMQ